MRVVVAMSGGVDSSIAAALMVEAGHEVVGLTMALYDAASGARGARRGRGGTCCSPAEIDLARRVCDQLGVPHYTVDERARFEAAVIDDFAREYAAGRTPNPCARCNEHVKFGPLLARARALGAERLVTGHYARVESGALLRGADSSKDQSYFLFAMGRETLDAVEFPLGGWTKQLVRAKARALGIVNADAAESQELCFVPGGDHGEIVEARARALGLDLDALAPGEVRDRSGAVLGEHRGIHRVTVGQRRGLGIGGGRPRYALRVVPESRAVIVGEADELDVTSVIVEDFRRLADIEDGEGFHADVQVRHRGQAHSAIVELDGQRARVRFDLPVRAVAPGQAAVVYDGDRVLGGGWIESAG
ncbi:tRNA-specific 2-thiouridylase MnmA [Enhygromyxa salina]|uniref:tRNA-specific 2-thiouridylase MnmA n=1 Tax=Enhygromyxa salina TaxID=215803 RepID=A0A2S9YKB1_9BACT|nr:tRNA 2-thiouridine(34) synthase MnmA [Enhygromyxa salina]PRQ05539.1 tRNA-specific 2-thiouridylase MnmA [Enhygromyxa salina]